MTSPARIAAARANGAKSRGPKTEEGRRKVAFNAVRHGLAAQTVVLATESRENFQELLQACIDELQPVGELEFGFVEEFATARWRLRRFWGVETALLDHEMDRQITDVPAFEGVAGTTRLALAFEGLADGSRSLALLNRYETRCQNAQDRALRNLREAQKARLTAAESAGAAETPETEAEPAPVAGDPPVASEAAAPPPDRPAVPDAPVNLFAERTQDRAPRPVSILALRAPEPGLVP